MNEKTTVSKILSNIWFWWVLLTILYINLDSIYLVDGVFIPFWSKFAGFIGLFVPFGMVSFLYSMLVFPFGIASVIIFILFAKRFQKWLDTKNYGLVKNIFLIFVTLLFLTAVVDMVRLTPFKSFEIFKSGNNCYRGSACGR